MKNYNNKQNNKLQSSFMVPNKIPQNFPIFSRKGLILLGHRQRSFLNRKKNRLIKSFKRIQYIPYRKYKKKLLLLKQYITKQLQLDIGLIKQFGNHFFKYSIGRLQQFYFLVKYRLFTYLIFQGLIKFKWKYFQGFHRQKIELAIYYIKTGQIYVNSIQNFNNNYLLKQFDLLELSYSFIVESYGLILSFLRLFKKKYYIRGSKKIKYLQKTNEIIYNRSLFSLVLLNPILQYNVNLLSNNFKTKKTKYKIDPRNIIRKYKKKLKINQNFWKLDFWYHVNIGKVFSINFFKKNYVKQFKEKYNRSFFLKNRIQECIFYLFNQNFLYRNKKKLLEKKKIAFFRFFFKKINYRINNINSLINNLPLKINFFKKKIKNNSVKKKLLLYPFFEKNQKMKNSNLLTSLIPQINLKNNLISKTDLINKVEDVNTRLLFSNRLSLTKPRNLVLFNKNLINTYNFKKLKNSQNNFKKIISQVSSKLELNSSVDVSTKINKKNSFNNTSKKMRYILLLKQKNQNKIYNKKLLIFYQNYCFNPTIYEEHLDLFFNCCV